MNNLKSKQIIIEGTKIAYYDTLVGEKTIMFIHANSLSADTFLKQFEDFNLQNKFRLVALDLPGCGNSGFSKNPEVDYRFKSLGNFVIEFVKRLDLKNIVYVGNSLGGNIIFEIGEKLINAKGIVVFGTPAVNATNTPDYYLPNPVISLFYKIDLSQEDAKQMAETVFRKGYSGEKRFVEDIILKSDPNFRKYFAQSVNDGDFSDEVKFVENTKIPIAVFHGKEEQIIDEKYYDKINFSSLWKNEIHIIDNSGHILQYETPNEFNKLLVEFFESL